MRKLTLSVIGMYLGMLAAFGQGTTSDSSAYKPRKLKLEEVDFVSSYYQQDGNNSAVTGGIGTEKLTDLSNTIELRFSKTDRKQRKHTLGFELGIDHYSSASSDQIDPHTLSSASYSDNRIYPSVTWSRQDIKKGTTIGAVTSFSNEYDYNSVGLGINLAKSSKDRSRELGVRLQAYFDQWHVILPVELRGINAGGVRHGDAAPRNSFSGAFSLSQIINPRMQVLVITEPAYQQGLLATKYQRVYFKGGQEQAENLPETRLKFPVGLRANYFAGDRFILRSFYRYYQDNWGIKAHTLEMEVPVKITPFVSVSPFYRYYTQTAADYFAPYLGHVSTETFFTSDYDLSRFHSQFFGTGFRIAPPDGVLGVQHWNQLELRYGHYLRSNGLNANQITLHLKFK